MIFTRLGDKEQAFLFIGKTALVTAYFLRN